MRLFDADNFWIYFFLIIVIFLFNRAIKWITKKIEEKKRIIIVEYENKGYLEKEIQKIKDELKVEYEKKFKNEISALRNFYAEDAIRRSKSVTKGKVVEHLAPFLINDLYNTDDLVFTGSPIDFLAFSCNDDKKVENIDFIEIKTGNSQLNKKQRLIRDAILNQKVYFRNIDLN